MTDWMSGPSSDEPTLISDIFDLADANFRQGQAVAIGNHHGAREAHRRAMAALGRILRRVDAGEVDASSLLIEPPAQRGADR
ncbi:hypothetical protein RB614_19700 [Phytohabitans sp. ZYX-F-186]|uniref:Uncharacterized protein n=1 Tax=Phytohabitans maris TaxID=3071409 RepID=A0ABU0ZK27_9ACTN|nr:hypothetical protein [Phytohabitans sp. ZYX-F-186]MDQ7906744.1 hypothetical protein [Phytohabitans sp. ZYX-F-186]